VTDLPLGANATLSPTFPVPVGSPQGTSPSRCRISSAGALAVTGEAADGEVEDHPAPIGVEDPRIGVAKRLVSVDRDPADALIFDVVFEIRVDNLGNVPLSNVQVIENLAATFVQAGPFSITALSSPTLTVNPGFNGNGNNGLLAAGNTLAIGASGVITFTVHVSSNGNPGPYTNQVTATATSPAGNPVDDPSQDGDDTDPNDNGDAGDDNTPTVFELPVSVILIPTLNEWGLLAMMLALAGIALRRLRRRAGKVG